MTANLNLDDIFISVKTTRHHMKTRLPLILVTWFQLARDQTWFFTDIDNEEHQNITNGHMVNTRCQPTHAYLHLCCKTAAEFNFFLNTDKKWFCHFDDDNYVNVPQLVKVLQRFHQNGAWYLGRKSLFTKFKLYNKHNNKTSYEFWFATGGAGYCISRVLAVAMKPAFRDRAFTMLCAGLSANDDIVMGFVVEVLTKHNLTVVHEFHSHLEDLSLLDPATFADQISFSYSRANGGRWNVVNLQSGFDVWRDPTRFLSIHCALNPQTEYCPRFK